jgi:hypothetical protein
VPDAPDDQDPGFELPLDRERRMCPEDRPILSADRSTNEVIHFSAPGTDVMILKIFSLKKIAEKLAFFTRNKLNCAKF